MTKNRKSSALKRRIAAAVSTVLACAALAQPANAAVNPVALSSDVAGNAAWDARNGIYGSSEFLPAQPRDAVRQWADDQLNLYFPGMILSRTPVAPAPEAPAEQPAPAPAPANDGFDRGPCPVQAAACLDLDGNRSWLQRNGQVVYGPVPVSHGAPSPQTATPRGTFYVNRKVKDEISYEFDNAPMPWAVYFTNNGIAFHEGRIDWLSHGCVHLEHDAAMTYFNQLQQGDMVYVY